MSPKANAILNTVGLIFVLALNALANILPINGFNTGQISGFYPNYFVPAGFTFGIWSIIYIMLIGFVVCSVAATGSKMDAKSREVIQRSSPLFQLTCLLNGSWIILWHHLFLVASVIVMLFFLAALILIYIRINEYKNLLSPFMRFWVYHTFLVYLGWISVATIANATALFVGIGWQGNPFAPQIWSVVMILIALVLGLFFVGMKKEPAYGYVLSWAFFGIYASQMDQSKAVGITAGLSVSILLALTFTTLIKRRKELV
jgi:benzodiazapine receptor